MVHQYHSTFDFIALRSDLLTPLGGLISALPSAITGSSKPPGLLRLLSAFVRYDETVGVVVLDKVVINAVATDEIIVKSKKLKKNALPNTQIVETKRISNISDGSESAETDLIVQTLIKCVASRAEFEVSRMVMDVLTILLERNEGDFRC